jgi:ribonuclease P protein component
VTKLSYFTRKELNQFFSEARTLLKRPGLTILIMPRTKDIARLLVITPRSIGTAPVRNKIRRQLKAIFYEHQLFQGAFDCVIIVRKELLSLSFDEIEKIVVNAFDQ